MNDDLILEAEQVASKVINFNTEFEELKIRLYYQLGSYCTLFDTNDIKEIANTVGANKSHVEKSIALYKAFPSKEKLSEYIENYPGNNLTLIGALYDVANWKKIERKKRKCKKCGAEV